MPTASIKRVQIGHRSPITEIISKQTPAVIKTYKISIMPSVNQLVKRLECLPPQLRGSTTGPPSPTTGIIENNQETGVPTASIKRVHDRPSKSNHRKII